MKKFLALALLLSCAVFIPTQAGWEWFFGANEPEMTSYEATRKLWNITRNNKLNSKEYEKEFTKLVALGASVEQSPYTDRSYNLVDHAICYSNEDALNFLMQKYKPSHLQNSFTLYLVKAMHEQDNALAVKGLKSLMKHGITPSETDQRWVKEEQADATKKCEKLENLKEKNTACSKAERLARLIEILKPVACESVATNPAEDKKTN